MAKSAGTNAGLVFLSTLIPGFIAIFIYMYILKNSRRPFPLMLEDHFGFLLGKILGFIYIFIFIIGSALDLRTFTGLSESIFMYDFPISVLIIVALIPAFYMLRLDLQVFGRVSEVVLLIYLPLALLIVFLGLRGADWANLLPLGNTSLLSYATAASKPLAHLGALMVILSLAYFSSDRKGVPVTLYKLLLSLVLLSSAVVFVSIMNLGVDLTTSLTFPIFSITRATSIGFIRNIEIVFVSFFLAGISISISLFWFMACYAAKQVFGLPDYRPLLVPVGIIIALYAVIISPNSLILFMIWEHVAPYLFGFFYIVLPIILAVIIAVKSLRNSGLSKSLDTNSKPEE